MAQTEQTGDSHHEFLFGLIVSSLTINPTRRRRAGGILQEINLLQTDDVFTTLTHVCRRYSAALT